MPGQFSKNEAMLIQQLAFHVLYGNDSVIRTAERLGISRNYATSLLQRAKSAGHIEITVKGLGESFADLQQQLLEKLSDHGVRNVLVTPGPKRLDLESDDEENRERKEGNYYYYVLRSLAAAAAEYVSGQLRRDDTICLGGGRRVLEVVQRLPVNLDVAVTARPLLIRPHTRISQIIDNETVLHALRTRFRNNQNVEIVVPTIVPGEKVDAALKRPIVAAAFGPEAPRPALCILDVASVPEDLGQQLKLRKASDLRSNPDFREYIRILGETLWLKDQRGGDGKMLKGRLPHENDAADLIRKLHVVGGFNGFGLAEGGAAVEKEIRNHALVVEPHTIREWAKAGTDVVVLANGTSAAQGVLAAAVGGYCTTLIVNTSIALRLIGDPEGTVESAE